jgi:hypothetical protein
MDLVINQPVVQTPLTQQTAGGRQVAAGGGGQTNVALTVAPSATNTSLMGGLTMVCSVTPTAGGTISIKDKNAGTVLFIVDVVTAMVAGTVLNFPFSTALRSQDGTAFVVDMAVNTGTWRFFISGFSTLTSSLS